MAAYKKFTLEENLALTNLELKSNVSRLASLISGFEKLPWGECQKKASELLKDDEVDEYVNHIRWLIDHGMFEKEHITLGSNSRKLESPKIQHSNIQRSKKSLSIYERNYNRLMEIAPGLEQMLLNYKGGEIYGKSKVEEYMDFNLELLYTNKGQFYFAISQNYKQNGDLVPDPDMEIVLDVNHKYIEALHFQNYLYYKRVYDDNLDRKQVDLREKKSQNDFLSTWLKNLKEQGHLLIWKHFDEEPEEVPITVQEVKKVAVSKDSKSIYEKNFDRLLSIAPDLADAIAYSKGKPIIGVSSRTGLGEVALQLRNKTKDNYFFNISNHLPGSEVSDRLDMEIIVNLKKKQVEALHFLNKNVYKVVYQDPETRHIIDMKEQSAQNDYLGDWLSKLHKKGHKLIWTDIADTRQLESEIIDTYAKKEPENSAPQKEQPDSKSTIKKTDMNLTDKQIGELAQVIANYNNSSIDKAKKDILKAIEDDTLAEFLRMGCINLFKKGQTLKIQLDFYRLNFLIPGFLDKIKQFSVSLIPSKKTNPSYHFSFGQTLRGKNILVAVYEHSEESTEGTIQLKINNDLQLMTIDFLSGGFFGEEDYYDVSEKKITEIETNYLMDLLSKWLDFLLKNKYSAQWDEPKEEIKTVEPEQAQNDKTETVATLPEAEPAPKPKSEDPHDINDDIPDFEPGQVQLTAAHISRGVTQEVIDRINETKEGVTIFPRKSKMINVTKSREADKLHQAMKPGFRLSNTGKFYYEGRSNRADKTANGI